MEHMDTINFKSIIPVLQENGVSFAGVFGSRARGDQKANSDLDLLIRFRQDDKSLIDLIRIENMLSDKLKCKVDLVIEDSLSPYIRDSVVRDLLVLYGERQSLR